MSLFLHLNENLVIQLKTYSKARYQDVYEKLRYYTLLYSETTFRVIIGDKLKTEKFNNKENNELEWKFNEDYKFVLTNELGTKVIFSPDLHLEYISRKRTRQGFNLYLEPVNFESNPSVQLKFVSEDDSNELKKIFKLKVSSYEQLMKIFISNKLQIVNILNLDMQIINEFSEFFFLRSVAEFDLIRSLYLHSQAKFNIILKKPHKKLYLLKEEKRIELDYLENHDIFLHNLERTHKVTSLDILDPNLRNPAIYYLMEPDSEIIILDIDDLESTKFSKCSCGGKKINDQCTIGVCPLKTFLKYT